MRNDHGAVWTKVSASEAFHRGFFGMLGAIFAMVIASIVLAIPFVMLAGMFAAAAAS